MIHELRLKYDGADKKRSGDDEKRSDDDDSEPDIQSIKSRSDRGRTKASKFMELELQTECGDDSTYDASSQSSGIHEHVKRDNELRHDMEDMRLRFDALNCDIEMAYNEDGGVVEPPETKDEYDYNENFELSRNMAFGRSVNQPLFVDDDDDPVEISGSNSK